jgi:hypothetical protein
MVTCTIILRCKAHCDVRLGVSEKDGLSIISPESWASGFWILVCQRSLFHVSRLLFHAYTMVHVRWFSVGLMVNETTSTGTDVVRCNADRCAL